MILCSSSVRSTLPFEDAMRDISAAGFKDIDLLAINTWCHINPSVLAESYDATLKNAETIFSKYGLTMRAMNVGFSRQLHDRRPESIRQNMKECEAICRFMNYFGAGVAALQPLQKDPSRDPAEALDDCIESLKGYYDCMSDHDIKLGLELHVNSPFESLSATRYLLEKIPTAGIAYDPSHLAMQGVGLEDSEFFMKNCVHAHLRDSGSGEMQTQIGKGVVDFNWVTAKLAENGYTGMYAIEYLDNNKWDALAEALKQYDMLNG